MKSVKKSEKNNKKKKKAEGEKWGGEIRLKGGREGR